MTEQSVDWVRDKLAAWGQWLLDTDIGLGDRHVETVRTDSVPYDPEECERMDKILCRVKHRDQKIFDALYHYYYFRETIAQAAMNCRTTSPTFKIWKSKGEFACAAMWEQKSC